VDVVFHLAAKNSLSDCQKDPIGTMEINVVGTAQVFDAALKAGVRKVAYAQSSVLEEGEERQKGFYAISKAAGVLLADGYQKLGLTTVGLRYFNVYGPGQDYRRSAPPVVSDLIIQLLTKGTVSIVEGSDQNKRDFIHVDDINDFHMLCLTDNRTNNRMFRLGSGTNHSIADVLAVIQKILGMNVTPTLRPRQNDDPPVQTLADISDAAALGWRPRTDLESGLRTMVDYIRTEIATGRIS
jgi:UDP-glucose 4-epimerase